MNILLFFIFAGLIYVFLRLAYLWAKWEVEVWKEEQINKAYREKREREKEKKNGMLG